MENFVDFVITRGVVNTTPHSINLLVARKEPLGEWEFVVPPSEIQIRVAETPSVEHFDGMWTTSQWEVPVLPPPQEGKVFLVSMAVSAAMKDHGIFRKDVVIGRSGPSSDCRREDGRVTGIRSFQYANWKF